MPAGGGGMGGIPGGGGGGGGAPVIGGGGGMPGGGGGIAMPGGGGGGGGIGLSVMALSLVRRGSFSAVVDSRRRFEVGGGFYLEPSPGVKITPTIRTSLRQAAAVSSKNPTLDLLQGRAATPAAGPRPPAAKAPPLEEGQLTPSEVLRRARANVEHMGRNGELHVVGEVWGFKATKGGHWTFDLKDARSTLSCIMFFNDTKRVKFELKHGDKVVCTGKPSVTDWGSVQLQVKNVVGFGEGDHERAFRQLKEKLEGEGLFAAERKRPLPFLPSCVGVVTSSTGAALHDVVQVLTMRMPRLRIVVSPTKVQGDGAAADIADALRKLDDSRLCDVILLVRGGGSLEDLWAFNTEPVARAVARCKVPVISGVGHETDVTIADLVADRRAATPSNAAEIAVPRADELQRRIEHAERRLASSLKHAIADARARLDRQHKRLSDPRHVVARRRAAVVDLEQRLERALRKAKERSHARLTLLEERLAAQSPTRKIDERRARVAALAARLDPALLARREKASSRLGVLVARLEGVSPLAVLGRGYAIARRDDGLVVRAPADAPGGTKLDVIVEKGTLKVTVDR